MATYPVWDSAGAFRRLIKRCGVSPAGLFSIAFGAMAVGCGGMSPEQACLDLADARADVASRCGVSYEGYYDGFLASAAAGDCGNVNAVRDVDDLYQRCLPQLDDLSCEAFDADQVPAEFLKQLGRD